MDKHKLIRIIAKDLEELKTLNEEIEEIEEGSSLIVDLALSRAKLLCQELELLKSFSKPSILMNDEFENDESEEEGNELIDQDFPEPELEILHFEEKDYSDSEDLTQDEEEVVEEDIVYDSDGDELEEDEDEESEAEDLPEFGDPGKEEIPEDEEVEIEEDDYAPIEEHELDVENEEEQINEVDEDEEVKQEKPSVRQIGMEELDDEDEDSVEFSPVSNQANRPVMREIPKPEPIAPEINFPEEKKETESDSEKDRSINETLGGNKAETSLSNSPISSLRAAIGLNDRFLFIKEIFNNNSEKYNTIIDQLDKMETIQQAVDYLKVNLSLQKNETSMKFVDLLKRRFTK
jgi:hypothetical protein